jgi:hypothetical protein
MVNFMPQLLYSLGESLQYLPDRAQSQFGYGGKEKNSTHTGSSLKFDTNLFKILGMYL